MSVLIHPTAIIDPKAQIGIDVSVGAYSIIHGDVILHDRVKIHSHVVIEGGTEVGEDTEIFPFAVLGQAPQHMKYEGEQSTLHIGARVVIREHVTMHRGTAVGIMKTENEGPHGLTVDPSGEYWYLSLAHGTPYGSLVKYSTTTNRPVDKTTLGMFPASMQISNLTGLLYCVNFNLHGEMKPSSVSVVDPETMTEIKQIQTGVMPHGSRISPNGRFQYSVAMMSGELFEVDACH